MLHLFTILLKWLLYLLIIILAYGLGSISFAIIICKLWGLPDPRSKGSTNPGATNVLRLGSKLPAALTFLGDAGKAILALSLAQLAHAPALVLDLVMLAVFFGHLYPIFFRFHGGKGVATACGLFVTLYWPLGALLIITWVCTVFITKISALGAIVAAIMAPIYAWALFTANNVCHVYTVTLIAMLLLWRHKSNIVQLITTVKTIPTQEGYIKFHGYKIWYKIVGKNEVLGKYPLICLHGGPGVPHDYLKSLEKIAITGRRVIFYDQLGCGNSDRPTDDKLWTIEIFKDELAVLLKELKIEKYHLLGQSWGGMLALEHTLDHTKGMQGLILASTTASIPQWIEEAKRLRSELPKVMQDVINEHP